MITETSNKIKGPAITGWQFSPREESRSIQSLTKTADLAKMVNRAQCFKSDMNSLL